MNEDVLRSKNTAMTRDAMSAPVRYLMENGYITKDKSVLDYGCGHGKDVDELNRKGIKTKGYDPNFFPVLKTKKFDVVICIYVFNVLPYEFAGELHQTIRELGKEVYVAVRNDIKKDGLTKIDTYQRKVEFEITTAELIHKTSGYKLYKLL
jgi:DNA phosphorothioation-associated putative methyltransferase